MLPVCGRRVDHGRLRADELDDLRRLRSIVKFNWSKAFPRKTMLIVDGTFTTAGAGGKGECRFEQDDVAIAGTTIKIGNGDSGHSRHRQRRRVRPQRGRAQGGRRAHLHDRLQRERGDHDIRQLQLSGFGVRG